MCARGAPARVQDARRKRRAKFDIRSRCRKHDDTGDAYTEAGPKRLRSDRREAEQSLQRRPVHSHGQRRQRRADDPPQRRILATENARQSCARSAVRKDETEVAGHQRHEPHGPRTAAGVAGRLQPRIEQRPPRPAPRHPGGGRRRSSRRRTARAPGSRGGRRIASSSVGSASKTTEQAGSMIEFEEHDVHRRQNTAASRTAAAAASCRRSAHGRRADSDIALRRFA